MHSSRVSPPSETKLVHVHTHSALRRDAAAYNVTEGWHAKIGAALKRYTRYDNVACWTVDFDADEQRAFRTDGIEYRVFPSRLLPGTRNRYVNPYIGAAKAGIELSLPLLNAARHEARGNAAIHLHSDTYVNTYLLAALVREAPVFLQHHGGLRGVVSIERVAFRNLAHAFVLTPEKRRNLVEEVGLSPERVSVRTMGVDTELFEPQDVTPGDLGYDAAELLIYVGRYGPYKGLDRVLDAFEALRDRRDVALALLGGSADDELYDRAARTEGVDAVTEFLPTETMIDYYSAADAYVSYPVERSLRSGDCGIISPAEALACGTPVVSPVLRFIPAEEREAVGSLPAEPAAFAGAIEAVLSDPPEQGDCVRTAARHFSWQEVAADIAAVYDERL